MYKIFINKVRFDITLNLSFKVNKKTITMDTEEKLEPGAMQEQAQLVETPEVGMKRHPLYDRMQSSYPDRDYSAGDDEYLNAANDHITNLEDYKTRNDEAVNKIVQAIESEPALGALIRDVMKGASLREAIARNVDIEGLTAMEGDPDYDGWSKAKQERMDRMKADQEYTNKLNTNREASMKEIEAFAQDENIPMEEAAKVLEEANSMLTDIYQGNITRKYLKILRDGIMAQADIEAARTEGEIAGKNAQIEEKIKKTKTGMGDGMPDLVGAATEPAAASQKQSSPFDDIFERNKQREEFFNRS